MVTLPLTSNRLHPTLGHVRVQVCLTGASFPERFANPIRKKCITALGVTVGKIRRIPKQRGGLAVSEKSTTGFGEDELSERNQRQAPAIFVERCRTRQSSLLTLLSVDLSSVDLSSVDAIER